MTDVDQPAPFVSRSLPVESTAGAMAEYVARQQARLTNMARLRAAPLAAEAAGEKAKRKPAGKGKR
jgi:hypothetical protein